MIFEKRFTDPFTFFSFFSMAAHKDKFTGIFVMVTVPSDFVFALIKGVEHFVKGFIFLSLLFNGNLFFAQFLK